MTKADIVSEIAKSTGVEKVQVQAIVEAFMESNISKNTTITIPEHNIPAFKPAKSFAAKVK